MNKTIRTYVCALAVATMLTAGKAATATLEGFPVPDQSQKAPAPEQVLELKGKNGLTLQFADGKGSSQWALVDGKLAALNASAPSGFLVRDARTSDTASQANFAAQKGENGSLKQEGELKDVGARLKVKYEAFGEGIRVSGSVESTMTEDRAITVYYTLPLARESVKWFADMRTVQENPDKTIIVSSRNTQAGATGTYSQFPMCAAGNTQLALALGVPLDECSLYRLGYNPETEQLFLAFDFGLTPATKKFPNGANFSFVILSADPQWAFRSALSRYYATFPDLFKKLTKQEGIWLFENIAKMKDPQDFHFMFHEMGGKPEILQEMIALDDKIGAMSFRYTTPVPYNMNMPSTVTLTQENVMAQLRRQQEAGDARALSQETCGIKLENDNFWWEKADYSWVHGVRMAQCVDPSIAEKPGQPNRAHQNYDPENKDGLKKDNPGKSYEPQPGLDGEYLDSLDWFSSWLDFAREHFATTDYPLTFARKTRTLCLIEQWSISEYCKWVSEDLHRKGKLLMANGQPGLFNSAAPYLDAMGREVRWHTKDGKYNPDTDAQMNLRRAVANQKPFLMFLNDDFLQFGQEDVIRYMKRALFYGFYPSMFVFETKGPNGKWIGKHYFAMPELYERDRPLFKKYIPLIQQMNAAGWQPITYATTNDATVWIERFGGEGKGPVYLTVFNSTEVPKSVQVNVDAKALKLSAQIQVQDLIENRKLDIQQTQISFDLPSQDVAVLEIK